MRLAVAPPPGHDSVPSTRMRGGWGGGGVSGQALGTGAKGGAGIDARGTRASRTDMRPGGAERASRACDQERVLADEFSATKV